MIKPMAAFRHDPHGPTVALFFFMRFLFSLSVLALFAATPAFGQAAVTTSHPYGLDPYKPSDAEWLRNYGAALVAQTPLLELHSLDPYKPSDAELRRQIGGAIPLCCPNWTWPGASFGPLPPSTVHGVTHPPVAMPSSVVPAPPANADSPAAGAVASGSDTTSSATEPQSNDGVWIRYAGQTWISAGRAVPLDNAQFRRAGEYGRFPVYKLSGGSDDVIYVPAREGMVAPYRLKQ
jgi:hypothetical protein